MNSITYFIWNAKKIFFFFSKIKHIIIDTLKYNILKIKFWLFKGYIKNCFDYKKKYNFNKLNFYDNLKLFNLLNLYIIKERYFNK